MPMQVQRPIRRVVAGAAVQPGQIQKAIRQYKNAQSWIMFDSRYLGAVMFPTDPAAFNFAQLTAVTAFFDRRSIANAGRAFSSNGDTGKFDRDFVAWAIGVEVYAPIDGPFPVAGLESVSSSFVEEITQHGVLSISFGSDPVLIAPVAQLPGAGGCDYSQKVRTVLAAGAVSDSGTAQNGISDPRARYILREPLVFKQNQAIAVAIDLPPQSIARVNALTALVAPQTALIRVWLEGVRGKPLLEGVSANPGALSAYNK